MNDYAIMDVETTLLRHGERPKTKFWGYYDTKQYRRFNSTPQFAKFLRSTPPKTILHHANFDIIQLLLDGGEVQINRSHNGRLINCSLYGHKTVNTFSCFPVRLETILNAFGFKKEKLENLDARNYGDCVYGLQACLALDAEFQNLCGVSPLRRGTIASTGFHSAEKFAGTMPKDLRFLEAYRGGRVEVFDTRKITCSKYDINSSYPTSILLCPEKSTLYKLQVNTKDWYCPFFASNVTDMLLFPNGKFQTWIYSDVLNRYILPNSQKSSVKILSKHNINFGWISKLKPLVQKMYDYKQTTTHEGKRLAAKFLLNSLYGRIGLKGESERARVLDYPVDGDDVTTHYLGKNRWLVFDKIERESRSNFPYAAYITDNARGRLYESFVKNDALYGDTDSCFSRTKGNRFDGVVGNNAGEWTIERYKKGAKKGSEKREYFCGRNVKDYTYGSEEVRKGGNEFLQWTLKTYAAGDDVKKVTRERKTQLRKRMVNPDGSTRPWIIS